MGGGEGLSRCRTKLQWYYICYLSHHHTHVKSHRSENYWGGICFPPPPGVGGSEAYASNMAVVYISVYKIPPYLFLSYNLVSQYITGLIAGITQFMLLLKTCNKLNMLRNTACAYYKTGNHKKGFCINHINFFDYQQRRVSPPPPPPTPLHSHYSMSSHHLSRGTN